MSTTSDILSAFMQQLATYGAVYSVTQPPVALENQDFTPPLGSPDAPIFWLRPTLLPGPTRQAELGLTGLNRQFGVFQISVFATKNAGPTLALNTADNVIELFKRGTDLTYGSLSAQQVRIRASWRKPGLEEADWYHVPVCVEYWLDLNN